MTTSGYLNGVWIDNSVHSQELLPVGREWSAQGWELVNLFSADHGAIMPSVRMYECEQHHHHLRLIDAPNISQTF